MRKELQRIEPWSVVKISFFLGMILSFVAALLYGGILKEFAGTGSLLHEGPGNHSLNMSWGEIWISALVIALAGSVFYAILGGVIAILYNVIARHFGGIEIQLNDESSGFHGETELQGRES